ncbi:hypothetical protein QJQ45_022510, partial [Haematococcus lacustris]
DVFGKAVGIFLPIMAFVAIGGEHCIANQVGTLYSLAVGDLFDTLYSWPAALRQARPPAWLQRPRPNMLGSKASQRQGGGLVSHVVEHSVVKADPSPEASEQGKAGGLLAAPLKLLGMRALPPYTMSAAARPPGDSVAAARA